MATAADSAGGGSHTSAEPEDANRSLFVTNVGEEVTEDELREVARRFGAVRSVKVPKDQWTGKPYGRAFIDFYRHADAAAALGGLHEHRLGYLVLSVEWSRPRR